MWETIRDWLNSVGDYSLHKVLPAALLLVIGLIIVKIVLTVVTKLLKKSKMEKAAVSLICSVIRVVLYLLLLLIVASSLGIDVTGIVALASVLTLAVSLALQNALSNLVGGFTLLANKPFRSDDFVEIAGQTGTVMEIGLTYTKLLTADGKTAYIPNSSVVSAQIVNFTVSGIRRVDITVSASYACQTEDVLKALQQAAQVPTALADRQPYTAVSRYGDSAIEYILQVWCTADDYWTTLHTVNQRIQSVFAENQVKMTYPHLNIHVEK